MVNFQIPLKTLRRPLILAVAADLSLAQSANMDIEFFQVADQEKRFITGQNQHSSHETTQLMMKTLQEKGV